MLRTVLSAGLVVLPALGLVEHTTASRSGAGPERIVANRNRTPAGHFRNGVLTLHLELRTGFFRPQADDGPGIVVQAFGEAGRPLQIPGPLIRVREGTVINATIRNTLPDSTLVLHGFDTRPGSPDDTVQVAPGTTRSLRFMVGTAGTYFYWGTTTGKRMEDDRWIDSQLAGALIIDRAGEPRHEDRVFVIGLWLKAADSSSGESGRELMVINGKSWPQTERLEYTVGDTVRWRWVNPSASSHPMHLHGFYYEVDSRGSWAEDTIYQPAERRRVVTELLWPGGTISARWVPERPGNWLFHCHFALHMSTELFLAPHPTASGTHADPAHAVHGMAGLVLGMHIKPARGSHAVAESKAEPRLLRLLVQRAPAGRDSAHLMGYVLQEGSAEPASDSVVIPGPTLVLERGQPVSINIVNRLPEATAVHWHGIELESYPDGVPGWSGMPERILQPIATGDSFAARFTPPRAGTFIYHSHSNELNQIFGGLYGPLVVVEPGERFDTATNRLVVVGGYARHDSAFGVVNGRLDPAPIELRPSRTYRFRLINIGDARTFFSLRRPDSSAVAWRAVAKDGADLPPSQAVTRTERFVTGPGETADFEFTPAEQGDVVLDLDSPFACWHLDVPVKVRAGSPP
jgi:FtsP/CotA-like multicopper oxidase with cupredoxin domain